MASCNDCAVAPVDDEPVEDTLVVELPVPEALELDAADVELLLSPRDCSADSRLLLVWPEPPA